MLPILHRKKLFLIIIPIFIIGAFLLFLMNLSDTQSVHLETDSQKNPIPSTSKKLIRNTNCGIAFTIPSDWNDRGLLGESKLVSPEDERMNESLNRSMETQPPATEEGNWTIGQDQRSLYISCQQPIDFEYAKVHAIKTIEINSLPAYETTDAWQATDGSLRVSYSLYLQGNKTLSINLGQIEYEAQPDAVKEIVQSIKFVE
jgi:hypothetical protein